MDNKPKRPRPTEHPAPEADDAAMRAAPTPVGDLASEAAVAAPAEMVPKDTYLRLAAEYDNFRKRTLKERTEVWSKAQARSEEHTSELQSPCNLVCRLLLEKKKR